MPHTIGAGLVEPQFPYLINKNMHSSVGLIAYVLVIVGALNWGLIGLGHFVGSNLNVVNMILGPVSMDLEAIVYVLVGLSGVWMLMKRRP